MARKVPMKLNYLRVNPKKTNKASQPCSEQLNFLLSCWRLNGVDAGQCLAAASALAACAAGVSAEQASNKVQPSVNFVLNKIYASR